MDFFFSERLREGQEVNLCRVNFLEVNELLGDGRITNNVSVIIHENTLFLFVSERLNAIMVDHLDFIRF